MNFLTFVFTFALGFGMGALFVMIGYLAKEVEEARQNGHRR